jgi:hypothetical protein
LEETRINETEQTLERRVMKEEAMKKPITFILEGWGRHIED